MDLLRVLRERLRCYVRCRCVHAMYCEVARVRKLTVLGRCDLLDGASLADICHELERVLSTEHSGGEDSE
ncbi:MAG: hypothetical protein DRJ40_02125 [Thermoprotei archaeon]|nr:MAG: hypothetical protein DRJ40_02125 [Thermoprotei archaeon]